jgi:hypothetical protein
MAIISRWVLADGNFSSSEAEPLVSPFNYNRMDNPRVTRFDWAVCGDAYILLYQGGSIHADDEV